MKLVIDCVSGRSPSELSTKLQFFDIIRFKQYRTVSLSRFSTSVSWSVSPTTAGQIIETQQWFWWRKYQSRVDTCNANSAVSRPSSKYPGPTSSVPTSGTVSLPVTVNHVLQREEVDFAPSRVPNSPPVHEFGSVEVTAGQNNGIKSCSPCIRQLFPSYEEACDLHHKPPLSRSELEQIAATQVIAAACGFLMCRLLQTACVENLLVTIWDITFCALEKDFWSSITPKDVELQDRPIWQVTAAHHKPHGVFFSLSTSEKMAIIASDQDRRSNQTPWPLVLQPLSAATRRANECKILEQRCSVHARPAR